MTDEQTRDVIVTDFPNPETMIVRVENPYGSPLLLREQVQRVADAEINKRAGWRGRTLTFAWRGTNVIVRVIEPNPKPRLT